jgi:hypothetical protein
MVASGVPMLRKTRLATRNIPDEITVAKRQLTGNLRVVVKKTHQQPGESAHCDQEEENNWPEKEREAPKNEAAFLGHPGMDPIRMKSGGIHSEPLKKERNFPE